MRFCPHCGLTDAKDACFDTSPLEVTVGPHTYRVCDRIAVGSICSIYRCKFMAGSKEVEGVFKVARDPRVNDLVANEANVLRRLRSSEVEGKFAPYLPAVVESMGIGGDVSTAPRQANILRMHDEIHSPDELYTLDEVRRHYAGGVDPRHMAWMWRRLLNVLGFAHANDIIHGAVLPMHVLIEPKGHKLVLIDWCCAVRHAELQNLTLNIISGGHFSWYKRQGAVRTPPAPGLDIAFAARCMIELVGGDPVAAQFPANFEPALVRYFQRCIDSSTLAQNNAWKLLADFDHLIQVLWGPRTFCAFDMPPKRRA